MQTLMIPGTDLKPSVIGLGTALFGSALDQSISDILLDTYFEAGGNFLDTAQVYADWLPGERSTSEKCLGRWMADRGTRERIVLSTKGAHPRLESPSIARLARTDIRFDLEASLKNLRTDRIDLYWLHRDDPTRPVAEILETLNERVKAGQIRYFGCSNWSLPRIQAAQNLAWETGLQGFSANQLFWSLAAVDPTGMPNPTWRIMDSDTWSYHRDQNLCAVAYSSQANGLFQKMAAGQPLSPDFLRRHPLADNQRRLTRIQALCAETGWTLTQVILGYLMSQPFPGLPLIGPRSLAQLKDCLPAQSVRLTPAQCQALMGR